MTGSSPTDGSPTENHSRREHTSMVRAFPLPGPLIRRALADLDLAAHGTTEQRAKLGDPARLPRPFEPATCQHEALRSEVWTWLEQVVDWINHEHVWDVDTTIPTCWPRHPHLVHQVAVLADQRRRAGQALTSDALEEWHRYGLPTFWDRLRHTVRGHCDDGHQTWPATGRYTRYGHDVPDRARTYNDDLHTLTTTADRQSPRSRLEVVDTSTGEVRD